RRVDLFWARRLRYTGPGWGDGCCPAVHEHHHTGEVIVHGPRLTDPAALAQLQHIDDDEIPIVMPRNTLIDFGPKERDTTPRLFTIEQFAKLFENFQHSAWHRETRGRYAVDEQSDNYAQFARGEKPLWDLETPWSSGIREKTAGGAYVGRVRVVDDPLTEGQRYLLAHGEKTVRGSLRGDHLEVARSLPEDQEDGDPFHSSARPGLTDERSAHCHTGCRCLVQRMGMEQPRRRPRIHDEERHPSEVRPVLGMRRPDDNGPGGHPPVLPLLRGERLRQHLDPCTGRWNEHRGLDLGRQP
ncbi:DUF6879 family protein, partial [Streptomyces sp. NPDC005899]|uniref:DUF6879 family protein n=1 Tax=Streptomyces sp. NPDC005899 TaxID=3155716 RepID=UPI0033C587E4